MSDDSPIDGGGPVGEVASLPPRFTLKIVKSGNICSGGGGAIAFGGAKVMVIDNHGKEIGELVGVQSVKFTATIDDFSMVDLIVAGPSIEVELAGVQSKIEISKLKDDSVHA